TGGSGIFEYQPSSSGTSRLDWYDDDHFDDHYPDFDRLEYRGTDKSVQQQQQPSRKSSVGGSDSSRVHLEELPQEVDSLIDDRVVLRLHNMPTVLNALLGNTTEIVGKQEVRTAMREAKEFWKALG